MKTKKTISKKERLRNLPQSVLNYKLRYALQLTLLVVFAVCVSFSTTKAQSVKLNYLTEDSMIACKSLPASVWFYFNGTATGFPANYKDSVHAVINFGDGTEDSTYMRVSGSFAYGGHNHTYTSPGKYNVRLIVVGPGTYRDTLVVNNALTISGNCGNIKGKVYYDNNSNCQYDAGELTTFSIVHIYESGSPGYYRYTDAQGNYSLDVPVGPTYNIELISVGRVNASFLKTNCPASGTYTVSSLPATGKDFAVTCKNNVFDLIADVAGFAFRPGRNGYIYAWGQNNTCTPVSGKLKIIIPSNVTFLSEKNGLPYTMSGDTVIFNFTNLNGFSIYNSNSFPVLIVNTNSTAQIGDSVCVTVIAEPMSGDANPTNNIVKKCFPVTNSYDPNEKQVGAPGMKANGDISTQATELNYTINFQNTGNDVAYDVFILDTLASNLDIKTLKINASSHFMRYYLIGNNVLKFEFDSIMLPDSTTNEAKSHGFVNYSISTKSGLAVGDKIENTGHIYFDFNSAIVTNTTLNTVNTASTTGLNENEIGNDRLSVFPNPFSGTATINYSLEQNAGVNLEVYNAIGEKVIDLVNRIESSGLHQVQLSATDLSTGFYLVKLTINGTTSSKKIMLTK